MDNGQMVGQIVKYSITKDTHAIGVIMDKIIMREKVIVKGEEQHMNVTGYIIQDMQSKQLTAISYWRLQGTITTAVA